ncbi:ATP-binding protein [Mesorhizobium kowhaii]|uniref:ATP-binding protein n=1 Tax=Mesorhizobium kowhaii TaxID=1300272 RepID=UPI00142E6CEE|nr:winged helix-turn-helix domain-containing protein [Mesorhizobium kowhaii]
MLPQQRQLLEGGRRVQLGSRALDILIALLERAGQVVAKDELIAYVWPDTFVEENNLRVHVTALRKALGDDPASPRFIANVPGRGYCFVAAVRGGPKAPHPPAPVQSRPINNLPALLGNIVGRDDVLNTLAVQVAERRLLTITGPGGIGKSTVALGVARRLASLYRDGVAYLDLAPVNDPRFLGSLLASVLGQPIRSDNPIRDIAVLLHDRHLLVVLDSCEHMIEAASQAAETLLREAPHIHILATSREPLLAEGEWVHRLSSLDFPPSAGPERAKDLLQFSAVQLFVQATASNLGGYELSDSDAPYVAEICRRLDGIALAIELAAARVDSVGIEGLAGSLHDVFRLLTKGRRTALPRHQTLRATLDWSYRLLTPREQLLLCRLAAFVGSFSIDAARKVASGGRISGSDVDGDLANLVAKSLVAADGVDNLRYRLLDTTRTYAREKLVTSGEEDGTARRHAEHFREVFEHAETEWEIRPSLEWMADYGRHLDNLRAALAWTFSPTGEPAIGVALTAAAVPLWFQLSLVDECLDRVQQSLTRIAQDASEDKRRMQLYAALGWPQMRAVSGFPSGAQAWSATLELAEKLGDADYQLRALWALWVDRTNSGEPRAALALTERFAVVAAQFGEPSDLFLADRMRARSLHFLGDQNGALKNIRKMLAGYFAPSNRSHTARFQYDQEITARITLARALWVQGLAEQALRETEENIDQALSLGHVLTLTHALSDGACPTALLLGDVGLADRYTAMLHRYTTEHALDVWHTYADAYRSQILIRTGDLRTGIPMLRSAVDRLRDSGFVLFRAPFLGALAEGLSLNGQHVDAIAVVDNALTLCGASGEGWANAELRRLRGEILLRESAPGAHERAEEQFGQALRIAVDQQALAWELKAATSLARLRLTQDRAREAVDLLAPVRGRLTEGFATSDARAADAILEDAGRAAAR